MKFSRDRLILMAAHIALDHAVQFMMSHEEISPEDMAEVLAIATKMNAELIDKSTVKGHA